MTVAAKEYGWEESYQRFFRILPTLTKKELDIIGDVADHFHQKINFQEDIKPLYEAELLEEIDHALEQADRGEVYTMEETMAYIDREFDL